MPALNLTRVRFGALALGLSALLFLAFQVFHPVSSLDLSNPEAATRTFGSLAFVLTDSMLIVAFTLLPLALLSVDAALRRNRAERLAFVGLLLVFAALGPFQAFSGVGAFAFSAASQVYQQGKPDALDVLAALVEGPSVAYGLVGVLLLIVGAIVVAVAIWRSGAVHKWAGVLYALSLVLFIAAVSSPTGVQRLLRLIDGKLGGLGGPWLAWSLWRGP
jgi:hypothetical protein